jgi:hypothetical protein
MLEYAYAAKLKAIDKDRPEPSLSIFNDFIRGNKEAAIVFLKQIRSKGS